MKIAPVFSRRFMARETFGLVVMLILTTTRLLCRAEDSKTNVIVGSIGAGQEAITFATDSGQPEPQYDGVLISQWLQTNTLVNPNHLSLSALTALKIVSPPDRMGIAKFELPVNFKAFNTNSPDHAYVQLGMLSESNDFIQCTFQGMEKGGNGCLQVWVNVNYQPDNQSIRARLTYETNSDSIIVIGPPLRLHSGNPCFFIEGNALFNSKGATFHAELREQSAKYQIELTAAKGKHLKTITGSTTNGMIDLTWDLKDNRGQKFKGDSFEGAFYVMYPGDTHTNAPARDAFNRIPDPKN